MAIKFTFVKSTNLICLVWVLSVFVGCGSSYPPVSGVVTADGKPIEGIQVMFSPVSTVENPFPGPFAQAVTDAQGRFELITRNGEPGATPGINAVDLYTLKPIETEMLQAQYEILLATGHDDPSAKFKADELKSKIKKLSSMAKGDKQASASTEFDVPKNGTDTANFDLIKLAVQTE